MPRHRARRRTFSRPPRRALSSEERLERPCRCRPAAALVLGELLAGNGDGDGLERVHALRDLDGVGLGEAALGREEGGLVGLEHGGAHRVDHRRLHEAVVTACRPTPDHTVKRLLSFEVASSTEWQPPGSAPVFHPNWFLDISNQWERKQEALALYASEMRSWPHARSIAAIEHMVRWRGAQVGVEAAEAFCLLRNLV